MANVATATTGDDPRARRVTGIVFFTVFLDLVGFGIIIPLLPLYVQSMGGTARTVGVLLSCFSFTQLIATPLLGKLSDRLGRRRIILVSLAGNAASMVLFALATKLTLLPLLFGSRIIAGATAGNIAACQAAIADVTEGPSRARGMGKLGAGIGLGIALGPAIGGVLSHFGTWAPPLAAAAMALGDLVAAAIWMPETRRVRDPGTPSVRAPMSRLFAQRPLQIVLGLYFFTFLFMTNLPTALPLFARDRMHLGSSGVAWLFTLTGAVGVAIQGLFIARISRALGEVRALTTGAVLCALGLVGIALSAQLLTFLPALASFGIGLAVMQPMLSTLASRFAGKERQGAVLGIAQSAGGLARTVGPIATGFLYDLFGPSAPFLSGGGVALIAVGLAIWLGVLDASLVAPPPRVAPQASATPAPAAPPTPPA
jgi:DHA1 family tetracycline resistance protein-like MFS transporter